MIRVALLVLSVSVAAWAGDEVVLVDFAPNGPLEGVQMNALSAQEVGAGEGAPSGGPSMVVVGKRGGAYLRWLKTNVQDWRAYKAVAFHARATGKQPIQMRLLAESKDRRSAMLRRFTVAPGKWQRIELPLKHWREDFRDTVGGFGEVASLRLQWDGGSGGAAIDVLTLVPGERGKDSSIPAEADWKKLAFPGKAKVRSVSTQNFLILTDAPKLDGKKLGKRFEKALGLLAKRYKVPGKIRGAIPFFVFQTREGFQDFVVRVGQHYGFNVGRPTGSGFSVLGFGASFWHPKYGTDRPTFVREATHAALHRLLGLAPTNWVQRGLAYAVQGQLHPDSAAGPWQKHFQDLANGGGFFKPLPELLTLKSLGGKNFGQLMTVMDYVAEMQRRRLKTFWQRLRTMRGRVHTEAVKELEASLGARVEDLHEKYVAWGLDREWQK